MEKRLIDADELKRSFNKLCDRFGEDFHISAIETEIDAAQTVDATDVLRGMWISVKDRLPEENENCLFISSANNSVYIGRYICTGKKGAVKFEKRDGRGTVLYTASHWLPMPEPPEEDKP